LAYKTLIAFQAEFLLRGGMRHSKLLIGLAAVLVVAGVAWFRHVENNLRTCEPDASGRKDTCTAAIDSGLFSGDALAQLHILRGNALFQKREFDLALVDYEEAARIAPNASGLHRAMGDTLRAKGDYAKAVDQYNEALRLEPETGGSAPDNSTLPAMGKLPVPGPATHWVVPLIIFVIALTTLYGYLRFAAARARERAGLPPRLRVKLPLYYWALYILLLCYIIADLFSRFHGAS
jgi:tetratricopeptide (TPR) repeat protein